MGGISLSDNQVQFLKDVASMAYGTGFCEGKSGGKGNMGALIDSQGKMRIIKFNTHHSQAVNAERQLQRQLLTGNLSAEAKNMLAASDMLRATLSQIADSLNMSPEQKNLLLGKAGKQPKLLTRRIVANFITAAQVAIQADNALKDIAALKDLWDQGAAVTSKKDMSFSSVLKDDQLMCQSGVCDEDAVRFSKAIDDLCMGKDTGTVQIQYGRQMLQLKEEDGKVRYRFAKDGQDQSEWANTGVSAYDLRRSMFDRNFSLFVPRMQEQLKSAPPKQLAIIRDDCTRVLRTLAKLNNDKFDNISTGDLLDLVAGYKNCDGNTRKYRLNVEKELAKLAKNVNPDVSLSKDALTLLKASKEGGDSSRVKFQSEPSADNPQPMAVPKDEFQKLAADLVQLSDSSRVDEALSSPAAEKMAAEDRQYADDQLKILEMKEEDLEKCDDNTRVIHKSLTARLEAHRKSATTIPNDLLAKRLCNRIKNSGNRFEKLVEDKLSRMQAEFNETHEPAQNFIVFNGKKFDRYDANAMVKVVWDFANAGKKPHEPKGKESLQRATVPLTEALEGLTGKTKEGLSFEGYDLLAPKESGDSEISEKIKSLQNNSKSIKEDIKNLNRR